MQVCGCVWHTTKSGGSFAGSVKPQSGQGAESVRMATSSRPGPWSLLGFWLWLQGKASAGLVGSLRDANGSLPPGNTDCRRCVRRKGKKRKGRLGESVPGRRLFCENRGLHAFSGPWAWAFGATGPPNLTLATAQV